MATVNGNSMLVPLGTQMNSLKFWRLFGTEQVPLIPASSPPPPYLPGFEFTGVKRVTITGFFLKPITVIVMKTKAIIGLSMGFCCSVSLIASFAVFVAVFKLALIQKKSPIYLISLTNICSDIVWVSTYFIFLVPSVIADQWIYPGSRGELFSNVIGFIINNCWYGTSFLQILMAVNRLVVICFRKSDVFTYNFLKILAPLLFFPIASIFTLIQQELLPCCRMSFDISRATYGFELIPNVTNYSNMYLAFPTNLATSSTAFICYSLILLYVHRRSAAPEVRSDKNRRRDLVYAVQFCVISMFHLFAWTSVRILPSLIANQNDGSVHLYSISAFMIICDGSVNSFVYLFFNREVRHVLFQRKQPKKVTTSGVAWN